MTTLCNLWQQRAEMPGPVKTPHVGVTEPHPAAGAAPADIVAHLLHAHHRSLRERWLWIEAQLNKLIARSKGGATAWRAIAQQFADLQQELGCCLLLERYVVFPQIPGLTPGLRDAIRVVEKSHARSLKLLWALIDQVGRAAQLAPEHEAGEALAAELSDLRDDYYQYLYEEECLLFQQLEAGSVVPVGRAAAQHAALGVLH